MYQKGVFILVLKFLMLFSQQLRTFPATPKSLVTLKDYLLTHALYSLDEFFNEHNT